MLVQAWRDPRGPQANQAAAGGAAVVGGDGTGEVLPRVGLAQDAQVTFTPSPGGSSPCPVFVPYLPHCVVMCAQAHNGASADIHTRMCLVALLV